MSAGRALVTGGTRGIGLGIVRALLARGCDVVTCGVRAPRDVEAVVADLSGMGGRVSYVQADISRLDDGARLVDQALARLGAIDVLVNNAGRAPRVRDDLLDAGAESFDELIAVNLRGPYFLTQRVARQMIATREGQADARAIVFVTSVSADAASPHRGDYCVSKAGLAMTVKLFALRLAPHGIPVFEVRPGIIETDMTAAVRETYDARIAQGLVPAGRWGSPADVGAAIAALVAPPITFATGSVLHVDGGLHIPRL